MVFSSHIFLFYFLPIVLLLNYTLPFRYLTLMLTLVSYLFYGWVNPKWVLLMLTSTLVDYFCGRALIHFSGLPKQDGDLPLLPKNEPRNRAQKIALAVSMISNLALLGFFKYYDFGLQNLNAVAGALGLGPLPLKTLHIALPIGISFYTFQSMSYAIDVYRGEARPLRNPIDFACFVSLFPHQLAGPIIRYWSIAEQIRSRKFTWAKFARGAAFVSLGLGKKILLATPLAHIVDNVFAASALHWYDAWYGAISFALQVYFDFSAYSDIAVGLALMLGFLFTKNFDNPYHATSLAGFRRRWHISLFAWLRDYLYIPLGGSRKGELRTYANIMAVMLIAGLWHGASWNFVMWGATYAVMLAIERLAMNHGVYEKVPVAARRVITFMVCLTAMIFFRTESLTHAGRFIVSMFSPTSRPEAAGLLAGVVYAPYYLLTFAACVVVVWGMPQIWDFTQRLTPWKAVVCLATLAISIMVMWTQTVHPFIYYQF